MKKLLFVMTVCLPALPAMAGAATEVTMQTSKGDLLIEVDEENAPLTAGNFLRYVEEGFFDGLIFHRVIPGFVIQGGGFLPDMFQKQTAPPIAYEHNDLKNLQYSLSMARTSDPNSATSQFFINLQNNPSLDPPPGGGAGYAVFGRVIEGQEIVDAIAAVHTRSLGPYQDVPVQNVVIEKVQLRQEEGAEKTP